MDPYTFIPLPLVPKRTSRTARRSKWPEPNTNYRQRRAELRKSVSTDEEGSSGVERENAKVRMYGMNNH